MLITKGKRWHVQMSTKRALEMKDSELVDMFGGPASAVKEELNRIDGAGQVWLHTEGCDNSDSVTGKCLGH